MTSVPAHKFLRLLGLMARFIDLVPLARLHMRPLQLYFLSFWRPYKDSLEAHIPIRDPLLQHAHWWLMKDNIFRGTPLHIPSEVVLWTDASLTGWGAHMGNHQASGIWTAQQQTWHINMLEMKAVELALHQFKRQLQGKAVLLRCDNSTVVAYINKQGGGEKKSLPLCRLTWDVYQWAKQRAICLRAAHIPGKRNILVDDLSRGRQGVKMTEWSLHQEVADMLFQRFQHPNIDLFACQENKKLPIFCSTYPDQAAWASDALSVSWTGMHAYAFPPPVLIPQVLMKVRQELCVVLLVAPFSPRRSWYPLLLELLVDFPRTLPISKNMLTQRIGQLIHPDPERLHLVAWKLSSIKSLRQSFHRKLSSSYCDLEGLQLRNSTSQGFVYTNAGVVNEALIHILPL